MPRIVPRKIDVDAVQRAVRRPGPGSTGPGGTAPQPGSAPADVADVAPAGGPDIAPAGDADARRGGLRRAVHRRIAARAPKLEAPAEAESGVATPEALRDGSTAIRLAVLGESTALGIGCDAPEEILAAQLALVFADREQRQVEWRTAAAEGATVDYCTTHLVDRLARSPLDVVVVAAGVNDLVRGHRPRRFARDVEALVNRITATAPGAAVVVSGLPDPTAMPLLPRPLAALLARRARTLDATLADAARRHHATFVPIRDLPLGADHLAADGFHPGPAGCRAWAEELAGGIRLG